MNNYTSVLLQQLAYAAPTLIICFVGMVLAVIFIRKHTGPAILAIIAALLLSVTYVGTTLAQTYLMRARVEFAWPAARYAQMLSVVSISGSFFRALGLAILFAAVFVGRKKAGAGQDAAIIRS